MKTDSEIMSVSAVAAAAEASPLDSATLDELIKRRDDEGWHALSDDEIETLVAYLVEMGTADRVHVERTRAMLEHEQMLRDMTRDAYERSRAALELVCATIPAYEEVMS